MAKILDKLHSVTSRQITGLRQRSDRLQQELASLEATYQAKQDAALDRRMILQKQKLETARKAKNAGAAKLQAYDARARMTQRAIQHGAAKAIFKAVREGKGYEDILATQRAKITALSEKRKAYAAALDSKHADPVRQEKFADMEKAYLLERDSQQQLLSDIFSRKMTAQRQKLEKQIAALDTMIARIKAADKHPLTLPEDVVLRVRGLKMYFGGLKAVDDLNFDVKKGEIFGLIGPNGAGKTTVFNCLTRFYDATGGEMHFANKQGDVVNLRHFQVHDVILQGIVRTFQNVEVIREVSVLDNLLIAGHRQYGCSLLAQALHLPILKKEEALIRRRAMQVLEFMELTDYKDWYAFGLPYGVLKRIEIARTLMCNPQLIILDEPAAGLNDTETAELAQLIRRIQKEYQCTILLVEHDMGLVMDICDTVCAISFGKLLSIGTTEEVQANKDVQAAYLGTSEED